MEYSFPCLIDVRESIQKVIQYTHLGGGVACEFARGVGYWKENGLLFIFFFSFLAVDRKEYCQDKKKKRLKYCPVLELGPTGHKGQDLFNVEHSVTCSWILSDPN